MAGSTKPTIIDSLLEKDFNIPATADKRFFTRIEIHYPDPNGNIIKIESRALIDTGACHSVFPAQFLGDFHKLRGGNSSDMTSIGGGFKVYGHLTFWKLIFNDSSLWLAQNVGYAEKVKYPIIGIDFLRWFDFNFRSEKHDDFSIDMTLNKYGSKVKGTFIFDTLEEMKHRHIDKLYKDHHHYFKQRPKTNPKE